MPELNLPSDSTRHRLVHVHLNAPGVLATINGILGEHEVNIDSQFLSTRGEIGYVITDITVPVGGDVLKALVALPETVRLRQLS